VEGGKVGRASGWRKSKGSERKRREGERGGEERRGKRGRE